MVELYLIINQALNNEDITIYGKETKQEVLYIDDLVKVYI